jgi:type VI secretion system secreted protein VgrG
MNRLFNLSSPFGDALRFERLTGREAVSELFEFELTGSSEERGLAPTAALGQPFTVEFEVEGGDKRYLNGQCVAFRSVGRSGRKHLYRATLRPGLWYATRRTDYRIFQKMSVVDIVKDVLGAYPFAVKWLTAGSYSPWNYCVQYRETDANFVMRLLEQEGLWFWFEHAAGEHTLVITDHIGLASPFPNYESIEFYPHDISVPDKDHLSFWADAGQVTSGKYVARDYNFIMPATDLTTDDLLPGSHPHANYEIFDFPGEYENLGEGLPFAKVRMEELHAGHLRAACEGRARGVAPGRLFSLAKHAVGRYNREYLVLACDYQFADNDYDGSGGSSAVEVHISADVHPTDQPYRPARRTPKPLTSGPDSAVVTGPAGQEIHTDEYGRVKVQFHWDRYGKKDETSSCWIRVSHPWAGSGFGGVHIPRIGQEVIVDYLNGDPDQPLIVGRVYNSMQPHPWGLPAAATQSGFLTRSTLGGNYETANALRFEDKRGEEQVWLHAERNQDIEVENDETHWVGRDRTKTIDRDETNHIKRDRTETVDNNETITVHNDRKERVDHNETISIGDNRSEDVGKNEDVSIGDNQTHAVGKNRTRTVGSNESVTVGKNRSKKVGKNESDKIGKNWSIKVGKMKTETIGMASMQNVGLAKMVNIGAAYSLNVGGMMSTVIGNSRSDKISKKHTADVGEVYTLKVGAAGAAQQNVMIANIQAPSQGESSGKSPSMLRMDADSITLQVGSSRLVLTPDAIYLQAKDVHVLAEATANIDAPDDIHLNSGTARPAPADGAET